MEETEGVEEKRMGEEKKKMMVCIDESEYSHHALKWTLQNLHGSLANYQVIIFTAQSLSEFSYVYASSMGAARMSIYSFSSGLIVCFNFFN